MKIAKVQFNDADIDWVDRQAQQQNMSRAELIRRRVLGGEGGAPKRLDPIEYQKLISDACRRVNMPRNQVDQLVNFVFCRLMEPHPQEASPD